MKRNLMFIVTVILCITAFESCKKDDPTPSTNTGSLWNPNSVANKIIVASDIHLGITDKYSETVTNRDLFVAFLKQVRLTKDVREFVFNGDLLDDWYLPFSYPAYSDVNKFYDSVVTNNKPVFDELNNLIKAGIKVVYIIGNHDMLISSGTLEKAVPGIVQTGDAKGLGLYRTGDRNEIVIEHGHRYDVFSAPDPVSNEDLVGNNKQTLLPTGYFYARIAATWVLQGRPPIKKYYEPVAMPNNPSDPSYMDQMGAYAYYSVLKTELDRITPIEGLDEKVFDLKIAGFNGSYSIKDYYPTTQPDGSISATLFKDMQRTWAARQDSNQVRIPIPFIEAVKGTIDPFGHFAKQANIQLLQDPNKPAEIAVFGHTHVPHIKKFPTDKTYLNAGTWIDHNPLVQAEYRTGTFVVLTTGPKSSGAVFQYNKNGTVTDISAGLYK